MQQQQQQPAAVDISVVLPEDCIARILSFTSPRDACTSCLVCWTFNSAGNSDDVWDKFLPSDYKEILSRSVSGLSLNDFSSKKQLYLRLCDQPLFLDDGNVSLNLEKKSGKKCFMLGARALRIDWGENPAYWRWTSLAASRFAEVAELTEVWWLLIQGKMETIMLSPKTTYAAYIIIKFFKDAYVFNGTPVDFSVQFVEGGGAASGTRSVPVSDPRPSRRNRGVSSSVIPLLPSKRKDGWMEFELGEFYNDQGEDGEVQMTLEETKAGYCKYRFLVEGIELRPKGNAN